MAMHFIGLVGLFAGKSDRRTARSYKSNADL
jgi:hypothetical protein